MHISTFFLWCLCTSIRLSCFPRHQQLETGIPHVIRASSGHRLQVIQLEIRRQKMQGHIQPQFPDPAWAGVLPSGLLGVRSRGMLFS